jgi:hypothetical protein
MVRDKILKEIEKKVERRQKEIQAKPYMRKYGLTMEEAIAYLELQEKKKKKKKREDKLVNFIKNTFNKFLRVAEETSDEIIGNIGGDRRGRRKRRRPRI